MKRIITAAAVLAVMLLLCTAGASAEEETSSERQTAEDIYSEQYRASGAENMERSLPEEYRELMREMGVNAEDPASVSNLSFNKICTSVLHAAADKLTAPIKAAAAMLAAVILCALCSGAATEGANKSTGVIFTYVSALAVGAIVIAPLSELILSSLNAVKACSVFMAAFVPVFAGILIAMGRTASAASVQTTLFTATQIAGQAASAFLGPFVSLYLGLAVTSSLSDGVKLGGICETVKKAAVWILGLVMAVFTAILTLQSAVSGAADSVGSRTAKFFVGTFVPVVGTYISESLGTVQGCLALLRSGVGMYAASAMLVMLLPHIAALVFWKLSVECGAAAADMFSLDKISGLLRSVSSGITLFTAVLISCGVLFIVCTGITVLVGGGG